MKEQNTAKVYAQSFLTLGKEKNIDMAKEMTTFTEAVNASNDLENLLFLDVFTIEEKINVVADISKKLSLNNLTTNAVSYLVQEGRITLLPLIFKEMIVIDDHEKGFIRGVIEGASDSIDDSYKNKLMGLLREKIGRDPVLTYKKNEDISAGYKITVEDLQLDASVDNQLKHFKESILGE